MKVKYFDGSVINDIAAGYSHSGAITNEGKVFMWGCNTDYRLMHGNNKNQNL